MHDQDKVVVLNFYRHIQIHAPNNYSFKNRRKSGMLSHKERSYVKAIFSFY